MSMQPMFTIQSSASSSFDEREFDSRFCRGRSRVDASNGAPRDPVRHVLGRVLLEEVLALDPVGKRIIVNGRSFRCGTSTGATAR